MFSTPWDLQSLTTRLLYTLAEAAPVRPPGPAERQVQPDARRPTDQVVLGHEPPEASIQAVVAIVADHQILARGHHDVVDGIVSVGQDATQGVVALVTLLDMPVAAGDGRSPQVIDG